MTMDIKEVLDEIQQEIDSFNFPVAVITDINYRLMGCQSVLYANQQLRYLRNVKKIMLAKKI